MYIWWLWLIFYSLYFLFCASSMLLHSQECQINFRSVFHIYLLAFKWAESFIVSWPLTHHKTLQDGTRTPCLGLFCGNDCLTVHYAFIKTLKLAVFPFRTSWNSGERFQEETTCWSEWGFRVSSTDPKSHRMSVSKWYAHLSAHHQPHRYGFVKFSTNTEYT